MSEFIIIFLLFSSHFQVSVPEIYYKKGNIGILNKCKAKKYVTVCAIIAWENKNENAIEHAIINMFFSECLKVLFYYLFSYFDCVRFAYNRALKRNKKLEI